MIYIGEPMAKSVSVMKTGDPRMLLRVNLTDAGSLATAAMLAKQSRTGLDARAQAVRQVRLSREITAHR